jgi:DNA-binding XRE family transcriptional regulator
MSFDRLRLTLSCRVNDVDQWVKRMPRYASSAQLRAARSLLGWTRAELAEKLGVARQTIDKLENQPDARQIAMRQRLQEKFEEYGIAFQDGDTQGGEGVRFAANVKPAMTTAPLKDGVD